jgi:hypothetical protein
VKRIGRALWWAGPWVGLGLFIWRQQGFEARLAEWVQATDDAVAAGIGRLADVAMEHAAEHEHGRVRDGG